MTKASVGALFRDHFRTLRDARNQKIDKVDFAIFYGVPLALILFGVVFEWRVKGLDVILGALALITGLLFNVLVLLFDVASRVKGLTFSDSRRILASELQANVTYAVALALLATTIIAALALAGVDELTTPWAALIVALLSHFALTLAMILKRIRAAFINEMN